ncbi:hypothetical protein [Streptomyces sp. NPDC052092]|uniref:hypothetical protein n=1 Tax=Streptomyces sp. NPDC052092 TaxID=3365685 RepID=UPI0037CD2B2B
MDYLDRAVTELTEGSTPPDERALKYAVLHLQAATEVLLKARLVGEHWSLVFKQLPKADFEAFKQGDFESCSIAETIERLIRIAQVSVSQDARGAISALTQDRNRLTHYGHTGSSFLVEARAARVLSFLLEFISGELRPMLWGQLQRAISANWDKGKPVSPQMAYDLFDLPAVKDVHHEVVAIDDTLRELRLKLGRVEKLVDERMKALSSELAPLTHRTIHCPECRQVAFVVNEVEITEPVTCRFCLLSYDRPEAAALEYYWRVVGEGNGAVADCPACERDCLVLGVVTAEDLSEDIGLCFNCSSTFQRSGPGAVPYFGPDE